MKENGKDARRRLIEVVTEMLEADMDIEKVTVRQIAEKANVGIGLINYHFQSKDNLLIAAVGELMSSMATDFLHQDRDERLEPKEKLKIMLKDLYQLGEKHEKWIRFLLTHEVVQGDMRAALYVLPILKMHFGTSKDEMELRILALQILLPIQVASLNERNFQMYCGVDLRNEAQKNSYIDSLVDNLL